MGEQQEESDDDGVLINKEGFPLAPEVWHKMWKRAETLHPSGKRMTHAIRGSQDIPNVPLSTPPTLKNTQSIPEKLLLIQKYISELQYDYTGLQFFEIKKGRPLCRLMDVAKSIIRESLPIKCLEAVVLAIYLTSDLPSVQRFPLAFKTTFENNTFKHIVLGVFYNGKFGALGLSRRDTLMYKSLKYDTLYDLLTDFTRCYEDCFHRVDRIKLGLPVSHDNQSMEAVMWKYTYIRLSKLSTKEFKHTCDSYSKQLRGKTAHQMKYAKQSMDASKTIITDVSDNSSSGSARSKCQKLNKGNSR